MRRIDHVAIQVDDIKESVSYYMREFDAKTIYEDNTWAMLQFDNIKLALVVEDEHPYHIAFEVEDMGPLQSVLHRDGSISRYIDDPSGNKIELIKYPKNKVDFVDKAGNLWYKYEKIILKL